MVATVTSATDVEQLFAAQGEGRRILLQWKSRKPRVAERVMSHVSAAPYTVRSAQFDSFIFGHPLKRITSVSAYKQVKIRDWFPDFAMVHLFHFLLEEKGGLFSYQEFREFCMGDEAGRGFSQQAQDKVRDLVAREGEDESAARDAMAWRVGNGYYSFLREIYLVAKLRESGLDARIHPLADALFRVDAWCGRTTIEMFVANPNFKDNQGGRKKTTAHYLEDQKRFDFVRMQITPQHGFGVLHLPTSEEVNRCIADLQKMPDVSYL
ncbi:hypothetical protein [Streptomyces angustmyceticus]|uniref:hypothetical protein n=1 Tax=Streptomyces angustmyceticus TaxID=285578 RepID=UPI0021AF2045|nr:hypothetical protein [Streptomyces angustmyceticus]